MNTYEKVLKAKVQLIVKSPFFASIAMRRPIEITADPDIKTACTDGNKIKVSQDAANNWTLEELTGVLAHEALHVAAGHHLRQGSRDLENWNIAADYAINQLLTDFTLPAGALNSPAYAGMSAEQIYDLLPPGSGNNGNKKSQDKSKGKNGPSSGQSTQGPGDVTPAPAQAGKSPEQQQQQWKAEIAAAYHAAKMSGNMPAWLDRFIDELLPAKIDWAEQLAQFLKVSTGKSDYSWTRPNPRYIATGYYLPALNHDKTGTVAVFIDTSGSITQKEINEFSAELNGILKEARLSAHVVYCDAAVTGYQYFDIEEDLELNAKGGGGTDFKPPFEYLEREGIEPAAIVYLTDGFCSSFPDSCEIPTIWTLNNKTEFNPPFGETIRI